MAADKKREEVILTELGESGAHTGGPAVMAGTARERECPMSPSSIPRSVFEHLPLGLAVCEALGYIEMKVTFQLTAIHSLVGEKDSQMVSSVSCF